MKAEDECLFEKIKELEKKINEIEKFLSLNVRYPKNYADLLIEGRNIQSSNGKE